MFLSADRHSDLFASDSSEDNDEFIEPIADDCPDQAPSAAAVDADQGVPEYVELHDAAEVLHSIDSLDMLLEKLRGVSITPQWDIVNTVPGSIQQVLGRIRCIQGATFKLSCGLHKANETADGKPCCMVIDINGRFESAQCAVIRWIVNGTSWAAQPHVTMARSCVVGLPHKMFVTIV